MNLAHLTLFFQENGILPELTYIDVLEKAQPNTGMLSISPKDYYDRDNGDLRQYQMGMIMVNMSDPQSEIGMDASPAIWSRPMPLAWYFAEQWRRFTGDNWLVDMCRDWTQRDRLLKRFTNELPMVRLFLNDKYVICQ